jgi:hypothetical protein
VDKTIRQHLDTLEATLLAAVQRQEQMIALLERKRLALRSGAIDEMNRLGKLENALVQAIAELEKRRLTVVAELTQRLRPDASAPLPLRDLADALPEPQRGKLLVTRAKLVEAMKQVQHETSVVRRASESLASHVNGLIRTIGVVSGGGAAYGQTGRMNAKPGRMSTMSFTA